MSFSFNVRAGSIAAAQAGVTAELAKVVEAQPIHSHDAGEAGLAVGQYLALVDEPTNGQELSVAVHGSIGKHEGMIASVSFGVNINFVPKSDADA